MLISKTRIRASDIPLHAHTMDTELAPLARHPGLHVSTILRDIGTRTGIMKDFAPCQEDQGLVHAHGMNYMMMAGLAWESWLFRRVSGIIWQPGEMVVDNIAMNADGFGEVVWPDNRSPFYNKTVDCLFECKVTWQSVANPELPGWYRIAQIMAYCHGFGITHAQLYIKHMRGDYKLDFGPQMYRWDLEFTAKEVTDNWAMIVRESQRES